MLCFFSKKQHTAPRKRGLDDARRFWLVHFPSCVSSLHMLVARRSTLGPFFIFLAHTVWFFPSLTPPRLNRRQAAAVVAHLVRPGKMGGGFAKCLVSKLREHSPIK